MPSMHLRGTNEKIDLFNDIKYDTLGGQQGPGSSGVHTHQAFALLLINEAAEHTLLDEKTLQAGNQKVLGSNPRSASKPNRLLPPGPQFPRLTKRT